ncbi:hypothetical protein PIB30_091789 [Stylosanthes scabra]|uniref:Uncharacterized protein n=1 Tax=Stylosanthes scabra TaxID=79078 RepID=A0ABU6QU23_9FABA|nr:hypothetical protein [Stylosanthes scabra]
MPRHGLLMIVYAYAPASMHMHGTSGQKCFQLRRIPLELERYIYKSAHASVGKITEVFHVTRPPAPRKKGAHRLRVGSKKIEPEKLLRSEERKESENPKNDGFIENKEGPQLKKKKKKVPLNLERKKEKKIKKQEEGKSEKKMVLQCSIFDKLLGKLKIFKKILHHHKNMDAHLVKDNSKWK